MRGKHPRILGIERSRRNRESGRNGSKLVISFERKMEEGMEGGEEGGVEYG